MSEDLIDARGRTWRADQFGRYVHPTNPNIRESRERVQAIRPDVCDRCGALLGDEALHAKWHRDVDRVAMMVLRPAMEKLRGPLMAVYEAMTPGQRWRAAWRADGTAREH